LTSTTYWYKDEVRSPERVN